MSIDQQLAESWLTSLETSARFDASWVADAVVWLTQGSTMAPPRRVLDVGCGGHPPSARPAGRRRNAGGPVAPGRPTGAGRGRAAAAVPALRHRPGTGGPRGPARRGPEPLVRRHAGRTAGPGPALRLAGGVGTGRIGGRAGALLPRRAGGAARRSGAAGGRAAPELGSDRAGRPPGPGRSGHGRPAARPRRRRLRRPARRPDGHGSAHAE